MSSQMLSYLAMYILKLYLFVHFYISEHLYIPIFSVNVHISVRVQVFNEIGYFHWTCMFSLYLHDFNELGVYVMVIWIWTRQIWIFPPFLNPYCVSKIERFYFRQAFLYYFLQSSGDKHMYLSQLCALCLF